MKVHGKMTFNVACSGDSVNGNCGRRKAFTLVIDKPTRIEAVQDKVRDKLEGWTLDGDEQCPDCAGTEDAMAYADHKAISQV